jgi:hypothetical protein
MLFQGAEMKVYQLAWVPDPSKGKLAKDEHFIMRAPEPLVPKSVYDAANEYALNIVTSLARRYPVVDGFQPLPDLLGKLTQIDNMTARLPDGYASTSGADHD